MILKQVYNTMYGKILTMTTAIITFFQPEAWGFTVVGFVILADLIWGIAASIKMKNFILSRALRETVKKVGIYSFALIGVFMVEKIVHEGGHYVAFRTLAIFAAVCELWSMSASMLIIKPDMPFLKLFRGQLKGEIEYKLNKQSKFEEIFKN